MKKILTLGLLLLAVYASPASAVEEIPAGSPAAVENLYNDICSNLACLCGCGTTIKDCPHEKCSFSIPIRKEVRQYLDQGLARDEIYAKFVTKHGETILAAPTFTGFNLMAWVTPFFAILIVGYGIMAVLRNWTKQSEIDQSKPVLTETDENDPHLKKMRDELGKFED